MELQKASLIPPKDLAELLIEIGDGVNGFMGTSFGTGKASMEEFLKSCIDWEDKTKINPIFVPMTIFWMVDDDNRAVGMVRVRHYLNDRLLQAGGHVGFYVRESERCKGRAKAALRLAINYLKTLGETRFLITARPDNEPSIRVILAAGGVYDGQGRHVDTGEVVNRYWIER